MQNDEDKNAVLASTNTEEQSTEVAVQEEATIKATSLQDNQRSLEKRDLSAIIPTTTIEGSEASGVLESKETLLKADGAVVIGNVDNGNLSVVNGVKFPDKIDIDSRKKLKQEQERAKRSSGTKKVNKALTEEGKKAQNITSVIVVVVILILGVFAYYFFNKNTEADFTVKTINIELGESLPTNTLDYVNPANVFKVGIFDFSKWFSKDKGGKGVTVNDMEYSLNTSMVKVDEVGEYTYKVTHSNVTKEGKIIISDTTPPDIELKDVHIMEGGSYTPQSFVSSCKDLSGCRYEYEDDKMANITKPGSYNDGISITAIDPYDNKVTKKVTLIIESREAIRVYNKKDEFNEELGYSLSTTYKVHLSITTNDSKILDYAEYIQEYTFENEGPYRKMYKENEGDKAYSFNDEGRIITKTTRVSSIDNQTITNINDIDAYLKGIGYTEVTE